MQRIVNDAGCTARCCRQVDTLNYHSDNSLLFRLGELIIYDDGCMQNDTYLHLNLILAKLVLCSFFSFSSHCWLFYTWHVTSRALHHVKLSDRQQWHLSATLLTTTPLFLHLLHRSDLRNPQKWARRDEVPLSRRF